MNNDKVYGRCHFIEDWTDWDNSIHCDDAQIERQGWSRTYPFTFKINKKVKCGKFSSTYLEYYKTTLSNCTCMDFQTRNLPCKHIYRLAEELGIIEIIKRQSYDKEKIENIKNSSDIDNEPDQIKRQKSAMSSKCTPAEIDFENKTAIFKGSGKTPYTTTEDTCTCRDFFVRRLPCKHIYRLRYEIENK